MTRRQQFGVVLFVAMAVVVGYVTLTHYLGNEISPLGSGVSAPNFSANTLDTPPKKKTLADYKGQVVLLNIWATWCGPCRAEMPSMEQLYKEYGPKGLRVVAVSIDDAGMESGIRQFVNEYGLTFDVLHDPTGLIQQTYETTGVPESMLIGKDGVIRNKTAGATNWNSESIRNIVTRLLAE
jgi:DsbE subfamily thiol:disulfide oxidoreductase